jgi:acetyl esterase/lipase
MGHRSAEELEADPGRLFVGGTGIGAALAAAAPLQARISAGPAIARQLLIQLDVKGHGLPCSPHRRSTWHRPPW